MISINRDTISIVVALLVAAAGYYLFVELKKQKGDIERCKNFSIELAHKVHTPPVVVPPPAPEPTEPVMETVVEEEE
jgi:hypothetical protein|tara:strand:- start:534 stop:764 length:231 start_codon:yes stop_codon:yes gene_type:complete